MLSSAGRARARISVLSKVLLAVVAATSVGFLDPADCEFAPDGSIVDAAHGGKRGFYWLPPLVPQSSYSGTFDPALAPVLTICKLDGDACGPLIATLDVLLQTDSYAAMWNTRGAGLGPGDFYRVEAYVGGVRLGYFDVQVVASNRELRMVGPGFIGLVAGRPLAIRFRVEQGVVASVEVQPSATNLAPGQDVQLAAVVRDLHGNVLSGVPVVWSSSDASVATVDSDGRVTAVAPDDATIFATADFETGSATITVASVCEGLIAYWPFEESGGTEAYDQADAHDGTLVNEPVWTTGKVGEGLEFNGASYVRVPDSTELDMGTGDMSVEAWVKIPLSIHRRFVAHGTHGWGFDGFALMEWCQWGSAPCGAVVFLLGEDDVGERYLGTCGSMADGQWHHYAAAVDRSAGITFYVDGQALSAPCGSVSNTATWGPGGIGDISTMEGVDINSPCDLCIGASCQTAGSCGAVSEQLIGTVDEVGYYDRVLSPAEVAEHYNGGAGEHLCGP